MNQGQPTFGATLGAEMTRKALAALNLTEDDLAPGLPLEVVSTGLPYLLVPLAHGLERAAIVQTGFEALLAQMGAKFVYVLHVLSARGTHLGQRRSRGGCRHGQRGWPGRRVSCSAWARVAQWSGDHAPPGAVRRSAQPDTCPGRGHGR